LNVPRFRRLPVLAFFLREYKRYSPDGNFRIIGYLQMKRWMLREPGTDIPSSERQ
jgi:hypothetical protein